MTHEPPRIDICHDITTLTPEDWDRCAFGRAGTPGSERAYNPSLSHAFLSALEISGSVGEEAGWLPHHLVLRDGAGSVTGVMPLYLKLHSYGEYVFDHAWAEAFMRAGGQYYPKLQSAVPFSPLEGPRLLSADTDDLETQQQLAMAAMEMARHNGLSGTHITFPEKTEADLLSSRGYLTRHGRQYHWFNAGYADFDAFLSSLTSRRRKMIRRERRNASTSGLIFQQKIGSAITGQDWDAFFRFYMDTGERKWGQPYLNRAFFSEITARMPQDLLMVMAYDGDKPVAAALNLIGSERLYGRYWGCDNFQPFLHFELCYYQAQDFAIANKLAAVEAGAQGEHKYLRGYQPVETYSAHFLTHSGLRRAVATYLEQERAAMADELAFLNEKSPFKAS